MLGLDRIVYGEAGRVTPYWLWIAQRASGVLLGPAVLVHVAVVDAWKNPVAESLLLVVLATHGYTGAWRLIGTRQVPRALGRWASVVAASLTGVLVLLGVLVVLSLVRP